MAFLKFLDEKLEEYFLSVVLSMMTLLILAQIIFRYFVNLPLAWTEEIARYLFIWLIYISLSLGVKRRRHIKVDAVLLIFSEKGKFVLKVISNILFMSFAVVISYYGYKTVYRLQFISPQYSPTVQMPMWIPYLSVPLGMALTTIRLVQDTILLVKERALSKKTTDE